MSFEQTISQVQENIRKGLFPNEAAVSTGVVLRVLDALEWPVFDTAVVVPEYAVEGRRVDYALCGSRGEPVIFLEVKRVGVADSGERQLFEYAFHKGVPLAVLTDGQEWNFYLRGEQGDYRERRVYKLDLLERDTSECSTRLNRYLSYSDVVSGAAFDNARSDYRDVSRQREIERILPQAWANLLNEADEALVASLAEKVEDLCGYKPDSETCAAFLSSISRNANPDIADNRQSPTHVRSVRRRSVSSEQVTTPSVPSGTISQTGFSLWGQEYRRNTAITVMISILEKLAESVPMFPERFAARKHGRIRRYIAQSKYELYPDRADLCEQNSYESTFGWYIGTNYSKSSIEKIIRLACEVAGLDFGNDLVVNLG